MLFLPFVFLKQQPPHISLSCVVSLVRFKEESSRRSRKALYLFTLLLFSFFIIESILSLFGEERKTERKEDFCF